MYFLYIDESGNTGWDLDSVDQPVHWLVGLAVSPEGVKGIELAMGAIARHYFPKVASKPEFEFHGSEMFQGREYCRDLRPAQRVALYGELLQLIEEHGCKLFVRGINKAGHRDRAKAKGYDPDHPHKLGFMYLVERLDEWLEQQQSGAGQPPTYGLLVADEQREIDRELVAKFAFWRDYGTDHGYRARDIEYLIDTVHYVPSHDSWLIQLVDCVAYLKNRSERVYRESGWKEGAWTDSERTVVRLWTDHVAPNVESLRVWP